jgi:L,D-peptidoglycan transpeptidase YkuD (ErfK/YbiS/YcfS/YnhG family)
MEKEQEQYNELSFYTLSHPSMDFIHQEVVDAWAAQTADVNTKPVKITFALIGLYLYLEKGYTGKEVQQAHMMLAKNRKDWLKFELPKERGSLSVSDVLKEEPGPNRDLAIKKWCEEVWKAYSDSRDKIIDLVNQELPKSRKMEIIVTSNQSYPSAFITFAGVTVPAVVGKNGVVPAGEKKEGDGKTPLGSFKVLGIYYRPDRVPRPETNLPIFEINKDDIWVDDSASPLYNQPSKINDVPAGTSFENLYLEDHLYDIFLDLDINRQPAISGKGSAIFLHCARNDENPAETPTAGCIAIPKKELEGLANIIVPNTRVEIRE